MRNRMAAVGVGLAVLLGVGVVAMALGAVGQSSPSTAAGVAMANLLADTSTPAPNASAGPGRHGGPGWGRGMHAGPLGGLVADGTITSDQATNILEGFKAALPTDGTKPDAATLQAVLKTALDKLVAAGTITSDQATKVTTAFGDFSNVWHGGPGWGRGMHAGPLGGLVADGTITSDQATKILEGFKAALPTDGTKPDAATLQAALKTALDKLVAAGTITSDQATKVTTAFGDFPSGGFRWGGRGGCDRGTGSNGANPNASPTPSRTTGQGTGTSL